MIDSNIPRDNYTALLQDKYKGRPDRMTSPDTLAGPETLVKQAAIAAESQAKAEVAVAEQAPVSSKINLALNAELEV